MSRVGIASIVNHVAAAPELDLEGLRALGIDHALIAKRERLDGQRALSFLAELPALARCWQSRLGLRNGRLMPGGVLSAALLCERRSDGASVVLKLSAADTTSAPAEAAALAAWNGVGACALLYAADNAAVLLLDAIRPGMAVRPSEDAIADAGRAAELLSTLHRIPAGDVPAVVPSATRELRWRFERAHRQLDGASNAKGLVSHRDVDVAYQAAQELHDDRASTVMCHGDFMNKNIVLDAQSDWWAIDPRPCVGDPCMDAAFWSLTHRPGEAVQHRCELVARAAGLETARVWAWALVFAASEAVLATDASRARAHHRVLGAQ